MFTYPEHLFHQMSEHPQWEFIMLYLKESGTSMQGNLPVGVLFCYRNNTGIYVPALIGMDYSIAFQYNLYRQLLFQGIMQAQKTGSRQIQLGISASFEKRKMGAQAFAKVAYIQARDNFSMELLGTLQNGSARRS